MFWLLSILFLTTMTDINCDYGTTCLTPEQQQGRCMPVKSCNTTLELFSNVSQRGGNISENEKIKLRQLYCGTYRNAPHVCCPESDIQLNVEGLNILKNNNCGVYNVNRIANGEIAALFGFPWMVLLKYNDELDPFKCGGTLISDQYVLTAAHCIKGREHILKEVRLGEYQISTDIDCTNSALKKQCAPPVEDIQIAEIIMHEEYNTIYNDIALIRLNHKVEFKRHIKPICLPIYDNLRFKVYDEYVISGWGKTETGAPSDILKVAVVPRVDRHECEQQLRQYKLSNSLNNGHLCAGGRNLIDSCRGDSGGPLGYKDYYNAQPRFIQFGIVAIGLYNCGVVNVPGSYTNVSHYMQWITDNLKISSTTITSFDVRTNQEQSCRTPAFEDGFCVPYEDCPFVKELSQRYGSYSGIPKYYFDFIQKSKCSSNNQPIRLCCKIDNYTPKPVTQPTSPVTPSVNIDSRFTQDLDYTQDYKSQFNKQGLNILEELSCGISDKDRVVGGNETVLGEYPWMALLRYDSPGEVFKCGGSLITNRFVLTAAHCVKIATSPVIGIRLGEHDQNTDPDCRKKGTKIICNPPVQDVGIDEIIAHPEYSMRNVINDIALIKLDRNVEFQKHIRPICLPITEPSFELKSDDLYIAGWGTTEYGTQSKVILKAPVERKDRSVCQQIFNGTEINLKHLCAGDLETGRDTCKGDSGGPLIAFSTYRSVKAFIQYGIVASGGKSCSLNQGFPGIYTNIITFMPWITSNIV